MNILRLTYKVKSLAGDFDTSVECDFLNDNISFMELTDLVKKDLTAYNKFIDGIASAYMTDYIDVSINEDALSVATIRVNDWKLAGGFESLTSAEKTVYNNFYNLIEKHIQ